MSPLPASETVRAPGSKGERQPDPWRHSEAVQVSLMLSDPEQQRGRGISREVGLWRNKDLAAVHHLFIRHLFWKFTQTPGRSCWIWLKTNLKEVNKCFSDAPSEGAQPHLIHRVHWIIRSHTERGRPVRILMRGSTTANPSINKPDNNVRATDKVTEN